MTTKYAKPIICCGFTPCVQRMVEFKKIEKGAVNRAHSVTLGVGGKGANTARMVTQLGEKPELVGFVGGNNGRVLEQMLTEEGVGYQHIEVSGETRICQTLLEEGNPEPTELVEEMPAISAEEWGQMMDLFGKTNLEGAVVAISGKLPAGAPVNAYAQVAEQVREKGGQVIIDAPGEPLLLTLAKRPFIVKINDVELLQTIGGSDLMAACDQLMEKGAQSVLITRGSRSAFFVDADQRLEIFPPKIQAVNPVGSGDAVTAGLAVAISRGASMADAVTLGMACGAANALNFISGQLKLEDVARLKGEISYERLERG